MEHVGLGMLTFVQIGVAAPAVAMYDIEIRQGWLDCLICLGLRVAQAGSDRGYDFEALSGFGPIRAERVDVIPELAQAVRKVENYLF